MKTVRRTVLLVCPPLRAFELFTQHAGEWWPPSRRHTDDPTSEMRMMQSGRFYERSGSGQEVELGRVRVWEPGARLVLDFYVGSSPQEPTEVTVTFEEEAGGTRVTVEHRPLPASESIWEQRAPRFDGSWELVLAAVTRAAIGAS